MATYVRKLVDTSGNTICPATRAEAVYSGSTKLSAWITDIVSQVNTQAKSIATLQSKIT